MDEAMLLYALEELISDLGVEIRRDTLVDADDGFELRSGSCTVRGRMLLVLDRRLPPARRLEIYVDVLNDMDLSDRYLPPRIREILERDREP